ncbi:MAG: succinate dehydrogenase [Deltaproteobacteria bacterium]|nr:MAG: succinate dehydrogenase [Deltaproteobacteria bacterium]
MRYKGSLRSGGAFGWFYQRLSGLVLIVLLLVHWGIMHHGPKTADGIEYLDVATRLATPFWKTFDLLFLVLGIFHGMNGLLMIVRDYVRVPWQRGALYSIVVLLGLVFLILGALTVISFQVKYPA